MPHKHRRECLLFAIFAVLLVSCNGSLGTPPPYWPTDGWQSSTPEEQGIDSELLADMLGSIQKNKYAIDSVIVVRNGYLVLEAYVSPFDTTKRHNTYSVTKSVISALVGIAVEQGVIESVDQPVVNLFAGRTVANLDARKQSMTLEHLLTMTTGLRCEDSYLYNWRGLEQMEKDTDWAQYVLDLPMREQPGTRFEYCNGSPTLMSALIQEKTGQTAFAFAREHLFGPLGISSVEWASDPQGVTYGYSRLSLRPLDMAKIGHLYLNRGQWDGVQVVPASWVAASTRERVAAGTLEDGYGYQWWIDDDGYYLALGYRGQFIYVIPSKQMVVVFVSNLEDPDFRVPQNLLDELIIPAARSNRPLRENPDGVSRLKVRIKALAEP